MFNLTEFRAKIEKYGGPALNSLFVVEFSDSKSDWMDSSDLRFFCQTVQMPGINFETAQSRPYGIGLPLSLPMGMSNAGTNAVFMLDSNHNVLAFFHDWMQAVYNYDTSKGLMAPSARRGDQMPYELGYRSDYALNMRIRHFSTADPEAYYECLLTNVYPTEVGAQQLSWDSNNQVSTLPVNFAYENIKMAGTKTGPVINPLSRSLGLLDYVTAVGNVVQTFQSLRRPNDLQDAINEFTSIKQSFSSLGDLFN